MKQRFVGVVIGGGILGLLLIGAFIFNFTIAGHLLMLPLFIFIAYLNSILNALPEDSFNFLLIGAMLFWLFIGFVSGYVNERNGKRTPTKRWALTLLPPVITIALLEAIYLVQVFTYVRGY